MVLYYVQADYLDELIADFRSIYNTSLYDMEMNEAVTLIAMLLREPKSLFYAKWHDTVAVSNEARILEKVQNAIIASIPVAKGQEWKKKDASLKLPTIKPHDFNTSQSPEEAELRLERAGLGRLNEINKKITPKANKEA